MSEYLDERNEEPAMTEEEVRFMVDNDQKAEWCIRKIAEAKKEMMDWIEFYVAQTDKVKDRCERRIMFFEMKLKDYFSQVPHKVTKTQESYQLPSGKLVLKAQAPDFERDDEVLLKWVKKNEPDMVKVKESVDWAALKKVLIVDFLPESSDNDNVVPFVLTGDGEIVPGIRVELRPDVFKVEMK